MRGTLRRSCDACAKAKHGCDLRTPRCSRCIKRNSPCVYANQPLSSTPGARVPSPDALGTSSPASEDGSVSSALSVRDGQVSPRFSGSPVALFNPANASFDPFDSYPTTRLPRASVQRLIHHFLSSIAFQYYPLDLNKESNPFVVSWWPLALADPALFHVSLQTASLDEESRARQGFPMSELLMSDSVPLLRRRIEDSSLALQDGTLDAVVTLAAIEHGKGNVETSRIHINGVKLMVDARGGIGEVKRSSPLTARMVAWVSMLIMEAPQFQTRDTFGFGVGLDTIPQWHLASTGSAAEDKTLDGLDVDPAIGDVLIRLRHMFHEPREARLTNTDLHDLTCFVVHKLLLLPPISPVGSVRSAGSECLRYAMVLYMLIVHGTTYYSHLIFANNIMFQLKRHLADLSRDGHIHSPLGIWAISVGMATAIGTTHRQWLMDHALEATATLSLRTWDDILILLKSILWTGEQQDGLFRQKWEEVFNAKTT